MNKRALYLGITVFGGAAVGNAWIALAGRGNFGLYAVGSVASFIVACFAAWLLHIARNNDGEHSPR